MTRIYRKKNVPTFSNNMRAIIAPDASDRTFIVTLIDNKAHIRKGRFTQKVLAADLAQAVNMIVPGNKNTLQMEQPSCALYSTVDGDGILAVDIDQIVKLMIDHLDNA